MRETDGSIGTMSLGEIVAASCELGLAVAPDSPWAMDLAARHLGRLLARGENAKLVGTLTAMAREFPGATNADTRSGRRRGAARRAIKRAA